MGVYLTILCLPIIEFYGEMIFLCKKDKKNSCKYGFWSIKEWHSLHGP
jgi:hypothetical protein